MSDEPIRLTLPVTGEADAEAIRALRSGQRVLLSGTLYTARDAAHRRMVEALARGEELPFPSEGAAIYYAGPSPARPGRVIGSAGPTTSSRMDAFAPALMAQGVRVMIGKGSRSAEVKEALRRYGAVYLVATGGAAALLARRIKSARVVAYPDLGAEAVHELVVEDFPAVVANDSAGGDLYTEGIRAYRREADV
ncbi:MAG: Fe-S-containing hydro-lyase [Bacillota bacterium]|nr:Fe-S-containing hydro-lyase [Bacillota bacterium]